MYIKKKSKYIIDNSTVNRSAVLNINESWAYISLGRTIYFHGVPFLIVRQKDILRRRGIGVQLVPHFHQLLCRGLFYCSQQKVKVSLMDMRV